MTWTTPRDATEYIGHISGNTGCSSIIKVAPADALITGPLPLPRYNRTLAVVAPAQVGEDVPVSVTASGVAADDDQVQIQLRTGGCPAAPDTSSGGTIVRGTALASGPYSVTLSTTSPDDAGPATLCTWLYDTLGKLEPLLRQQTITITPPPVDADHDGVVAGPDCDDTNSAIKPGAPEIRGNKVDENCDGIAAPYLRINATATLGATRLRTGSTRINSLVLRQVPRSFGVRVRCTGRGCRPGIIGTFRAPQGRQTLSLTARVKGMRLAPGAKLSLKVYASGYRSRIFSYTVQRRSSPVRVVRCANPGSTSTLPAEVLAHRPAPRRPRRRVATAGAVGFWLALAAALAACGGAAAPPHFMSCTAYLKITDEDARQDAVSQAAAALHIRLVSPGIGGKGAPQLVAAREAVDRRCRATPILELDEAIGGAQLAVPAVAPGSTTAAAGSTAATFTPAQLHAWTLALDPSRTPADTGALVNKARMHVTVALGTATAPTQLPAAFAAMVDACAVDPAEDAVLPFQTTLRNDSAVALDTTLHLKVRDLRDAGAGDPIPVEAATVFADGPSCESLASDETSLHYPRIPPHRDVVQRYVLVLHHFFSPNYDRHGNVYGLRHLVGYISDPFVFVAGGDQSTYIRLNATDCYTGTPHQGVEGLYLDGVEPAFALAIGDFDYATATPDGDELSEPKGQTAC